MRVFSPQKIEVLRRAHPSGIHSGIATVGVVDGDKMSKIVCNLLTKRSHYADFSIKMFIFVRK
jgi:CRISPR/Cas system-associated protein Cas10 (large subunit of type III CRISPR-Cas system)